MKTYISEGYVEVFGHKKWCRVEFKLPDNHDESDLHRAENEALTDWIDDNASYDTEIKLITHGTDTAT